MEHNVMMQLFYAIADYHLYYFITIHALDIHILVDNYYYIIDCMSLKCYLQRHREMFHMSLL